MREAGGARAGRSMGNRYAATRSPRDTSGTEEAACETRTGEQSTVDDEAWLRTQEHRSAAECWWPSSSAAPSAWCNSSVARNGGNATRHRPRTATSRTIETGFFIKTLGKWLYVTDGSVSGQV